LNNIAYERDSLEIKVKLNVVYAKRFALVGGKEGAAALQNEEKDKNMKLLKVIKNDYLK
jgi:hypothetical protein